MNSLKQITAILVLTAAALTSCSTAKSILALDSDKKNTSPINNPFGNYYSAGHGEASDPIILRTKKGDRSVEVELPRQDQAMTDFVIPVSPAFKDSATGGGRAPAADPSNGSVDSSYKDQVPTYSDREILASMPQGSPEDESSRREIETGLGLVPAEDVVPQQDKSYLAQMDQIKQLYRFGRYEAALIEVDSMLRNFQTDSKLYEMRGTLLDRLGKKDLAIKAWNQALRFDANNISLRKFVERRQQSRGLASP